MKPTTRWAISFLAWSSFAMATGDFREADNLVLAAALFDALERGDKTAFAACCSPQLRVWHSFDERELDFDETMASLDWLFHELPERRYENVYRKAFDEGFFQQHVLAGRLVNGKSLIWPACAICRVQAGRIQRIDEYMDSAPLSAFPSVAATDG